MFAASGADFYCQILPNARKHLLDDCGHFMAIDKAVETAELITGFFDQHSAGPFTAPTKLPVVECTIEPFESASTTDIEIDNTSL